MPHTSTIDAANRLVRCTCSGTMSIAEAIEYFDEIAADPDLPDGAIDVVDFAAVEQFDFDYSGARTIVDAYREYREAKTLAASILFCPTELSYGVARMMVSLFEGVAPAGGVRIARSEDELAGLLTEQRAEGGAGG